MKTDSIRDATPKPSSLDDVLLGIVAAITAPPGGLLLGTGTYERWAVDFAKSQLTKHGCVPSETERKCEWTPDDDGIYHTTCNNAFVFTDPGPEENHFKFCCYCSGVLKANRQKGEV